MLHVPAIIRNKCEHKDGQQQQQILRPNVPAVDKCATWIEIPDARTISMRCLLLIAHTAHVNSSIRIIHAKAGCGDDGRASYDKRHAFIFQHHHHAKKRTRMVCGSSWKTSKFIAAAFGKLCGAKPKMSLKDTFSVRERVRSSHLLNYHHIFINIFFTTFARVRAGAGLVR